MTVKDIRKGGGFLIEETPPAEIFTPEDFSDEQKMFAKTAEDFLVGEVLANLDATEAQEPGAMAGLLKKAGELGLLMIDVPERFGGLELDKATSMLVSEIVSKGGAFATSYGAHCGIGTLPIVYFGTEEQKQKYLPRLATGEIVGCYCLTEANSGSDALAASSTAVLDGDHYVLNGEKTFISNGGFADLFIVFAKIDGEHFTGFILERDYEGLSLGAEEHKMGIKGSSTVKVFMDNVRVPKDNLLGEVGRGHKIAFNILNVGRFKLGVGCVGGSKLAMEDAIKYANERTQFGKPISSFGLMKSKVANMATQIYAAESMSYRTAGLLDTILEPIGGEDADYAARTMEGIEEYVTECSVLKVKGSEVLDYVVDEAVQMLGGYGYIAEYPAERYYRDARISRIYEGTNEINRMLIPGMLLKRAMKGQLPLLAAAKQLQEELLEVPSFGDDDDDVLLATERKLVANAKKIAVLMTGLAAQKYGAELDQHQGVLAGIADLIIEAYAMECVLLRSLKLAETQGEDTAATVLDMTRLYCNDAMGKIDLWTREVLAGCAEGDELRTLMAAARRMTRYTPIDSLHLREKIADFYIAKEAYAVT